MKKQQQEHADTVSAGPLPGEAEQIEADQDPKGHIEQQQQEQQEQQQQQQHVGTLERKLKARHIHFLALSGAIGTGLFVGSGQVLSLAGPLSAFLCYAITGFNLYCPGRDGGLASRAGAMPVFAARYVDPALGFTLGWTYWYQFAIGVPIEVTVCGVVVDYWPNSVPRAALMTVLLAPMVLANCLPVRVYGEAEFVLGAVKLITIVGLILLMFIVTVGGSLSGEVIGFRYWDDPGPMNTYHESGHLGRFLAFCKVFIQATFSYGGSEMVVVASGETINPRRNIPKAIRRVFWRIAIFYVLSIFLVGLCVFSKDAKLLNAISSSAPGAAQSPFVIAIQNAGIRALPSIINAVILTSAWTAKAPSIMKREQFGVPYVCVAATTALSCLVYLNVNNRSADVFFWISNLSAVNTLIMWASLCYTYIHFYYALRHHGVSRDALPYRSPLQPFLAYFAIVFCLVVALFNGFDAFFPARFSARAFVPPYIGIPIFLTLFLGYKLVKKTRFVTLSEMDLWSGKADIDRLEGTWTVAKPRNWLEKIWFWIA
ncbi:hypothetical protein E4U41_003735 [Claviceps citrina]|nr:hypothetical protein E4U41_003735 [Claviceps citrina]